jgi:hypothetical protein
MFVHTVILVRLKTGESAQLSFAPIFVGDFFDLGEFRPMSSQKFADLGEIRPNRGNSPKSAKFRPNFFGAKFNCADSPILNKFRKKKNYYARGTNIIHYGWLHEMIIDQWG